MINSFKNPAIMRILRTTERHGAGWREQNFIPGIRRREQEEGAEKSAPSQRGDSLCPYEGKQNGFKVFCCLETDFSLIVPQVPETLLINCSIRTALSCFICFVT